MNNTLESRVQAIVRLSAEIEQKKQELMKLLGGPVGVEERTVRKRRRYTRKVQKDIPGNYEYLSRILQPRPGGVSKDFIFKQARQDGRYLSRPQIAALLRNGKTKGLYEDVGAGIWKMKQGSAGGWAGGLISSYTHRIENP